MPLETGEKVRAVLAGRDMLAALAGIALVITIAFAPEADWRVGIASFVTLVLFVAWWVVAKEERAARGAALVTLRTDAASELQRVRDGQVIAVAAAIANTRLEERAAFVSAGLAAWPIGRVGESTIIFVQHEAHAFTNDPVDTNTAIFKLRPWSSSPHALRLRIEEIRVQTADGSLPLGNAHSPHEIYVTAGLGPPFDFTLALNSTACSHLRAEMWERTSGTIKGYTRLSLMIVGRVLRPADQAGAPLKCCTQVWLRIST